MKRLQSKSVRIGLVVVCLAAVAAVTVLAGRWVLSLRDPEILLRFQELISSLEIGGWLLLLAIQYIQIVVAFIPGGPIQLVAGALFGPVGGLTVCLTGIFLATSTVFPLVSKYGHRVIRLFVKEKELTQYKFLQNNRRLEGLIFLLFLLPGTPKDVLTYLFALTPIPMSRFLLLSMVARIPAALTSVLAGDSVMNGEWVKALAYFVVITAISLGGLLLQRKVMARLRKKRN